MKKSKVNFPLVLEIAEKQLEDIPIVRYTFIEEYQQKVQVTYYFAHICRMINPKPKVYE